MDKLLEISNKLTDFWLDLLEIPMSPKKILLFPIMVGAMMLDFLMFGWIPFYDEDRLL